MRLHRLLLHALLCLALVANGLGAAMASVHAGCDHGSSKQHAPIAKAQVDTAAVTPTTEMPPCHTSMATADNVTPVTQTPPAAHDSDGGDQHCAGGCHCIAHCMTALMPPMLQLATPAGIAYASAPAYAHSAPTLPHPIRPPIG